MPVGLNILRYWPLIGRGWSLDLDFSLWLAPGPCACGSRHSQVFSRQAGAAQMAHHGYTSAIHHWIHGGGSELIKTCRKVTMDKVCRYLNVVIDKSLHYIWRRIDINPNIEFILLYTHLDLILLCMLEIQTPVSWSYWELISVQGCSTLLVMLYSGLSRKGYPGLATWHSSQIYKLFTRCQIVRYNSRVQSSVSQTRDNDWAQTLVSSN